jgi:hypothetical protein
MTSRSGETRPPSESGWRTARIPRCIQDEVSDPTAECSRGAGPADGAYSDHAAFGQAAGPSTRISYSTREVDPPGHGRATRYVVAPADSAPASWPLRGSTPECAVTRRAVVVAPAVAVHAGHDHGRHDERGHGGPRSLGGLAFHALRAARSAPRLGLVQRHGGANWLFCDPPFFMRGSLPGPRGVSRRRQGARDAWHKRTDGAGAVTPAPSSFASR